MATSGTTSFELDVTDYIEEAFERCGLEVRTGYDLKTAKRSLNLMLAEWANRGLNQWTIAQRTQALTESDGEYTIGTDVIDILSVIVRRSDTDYALGRLSRDEYLTIPNKTTEGRPNQFFLDRQIAPNLKVWPIPENSTDVLHYDALTRVEDAGSPINTLDVPFGFILVWRRGWRITCRSNAPLIAFKCSKLCMKKSLSGPQQKIAIGLRLTLYLNTNIIGLADGKICFWKKSLRDFGSFWSTLPLSFDAKRVERLISRSR